MQQLSGRDSLTVEDMMKLQNSNVSLHAAESIPVLVQLVDTLQMGEKELDLLKKLKNWNFSYEKDAVEPVIFETWWSKFYEMTLDEVMVWKDSLPILMPEKWKLTQMARVTPDDLIFDDKKTPEHESAANIATTSFKKTLEELADDLVKPDFNWAAQKNTSIFHLTRIPAFSRMNLDVGGNRNALNAISETHGPSWRMVVELGDEVKAWGVFPGGQSGNPGSPFYETGIEKWSKGEYNELFFMKNAEDSRQPILFSMEIN